MIRRLVWGVVVTGVIWLLLAHATELRHVLEACAQARPGWLAVAVLLQVAYQFAYAGIYQTAMAAFDVRIPLPRMTAVFLGALALNFVAPGSGNALFVTEASRRGLSASRAAAGAVLVRVVDFATFALLVIYALIYLAVRHDLYAYELAGGVGLVAVIAGWALLLVLGIWWPAALLRLLGWVSRLVAWVSARMGKPSPLDEGWAQRMTDEYGDAAKLAADEPRRLLPPVWVSLLAHAIDLLSLGALFAAFSQPAHPGLIITGFTIAVLFWIVAITPQGVGVVEGSMAFVYHSLGVEVATATSIALAFRALTFWLPMLAGWLALPRVAQRPRLVGRPRTWPASLGAVLCAAMGLVNVLSAVTPSLASRWMLIEQHLPTTLHRGGRLTAALAGFALLWLAQGLARRKRVAWAGALVALVVSVFANLIKGLDYEETLLCCALLTYLVVYRHWFHASSDRPSVYGALRLVGAALAFTLLYGVLGFYLLDHHFHTNFGLRAAVRQTLVMFVEYYDPGLQPVTRFGRHFADSIYWIGALTTGYAFLLLLRPVLVRSPATADERRRAAEIVAAHGRSGLARFCLFDDKRYWFSPGGSVVAFTVKGRVALALGDPIGPEADLPAAITAFSEHCQRMDWRPAFYETMPDLLPAYQAAGLHALCMGHAAVVDLAAFSLEGKAFKNPRNTLNRYTKEGWTAKVFEPPLPPELIEDLREISNEWLSIKRGNEKQFALGWFDPDYLRGCQTMVVLDPDGRPRAFANLVPEYQRNEATIDLMRHEEDVPSNAMEYLFTSLLLWAKEQGYDSFDLGLSSLAGVGDEPGDPALERVLGLIYEHVNRFYNFKGLHTFKSKFGPRWEPRYLVHAGAAALPAVWTAIMRANGGEDFARAYLHRSCSS